MHSYTLKKWKHDHAFQTQTIQNENNSKKVFLITAFTMVLEIIAGTFFGSMALLADGWHMATHTAAFGITLFAYHYARKNSQNPEFTFGTGKVGVLGGFASAVGLIVVALFMVTESIVRFFNPTTIMYYQAIGVALLGLMVNILCAFLLHKHDGHHHDHNLKSAYVHVIADALTSVLAILALFCGKLFGWGWMDPVMGIVGAIIITKWGIGLLKNTSRVLLDVSPKDIRMKIKTLIEAQKDYKVSDLHVWYVGPNDLSAIISIVTHYSESPKYFKKLLSDVENLSHVTVEVFHCTEEPCLPLAVH